MSNFESTVEVDCTAQADDLVPTVEVLTPRDVLLGPHQVVRRVLPNRDRRMIGAWCFVDHYGPEDIVGEVGMWVPPHPHTGLQTASWLFTGEVRHRDSLGNDALVEPGQLNLMTAGAGIAHSEESPADHGPLLHGLQLWIALPTPARDETPRAFHQYAELPVVTLDGATARVVLGELAGAESPAPTHTPLLGAELAIDGAASLPLRRDFEHGVLAVDGSIAVEGQPLQTSEICYVGGSRDEVAIEGSGRAFLMGGEPFDEPIVMWWNFIGRTHDEIVEARRVWNDGGGERFGVVEGFAGDRLTAPPMPNVALRPRGRRR